jgi:hypothetical protein
MAEWQQRAERFLLPLPLRYRIAAGTEWFAGRTHDVSGTGIAFTAGSELAIGTEIELNLELEAGGKPLPSVVIARASVVRVLANQSQLLLAAKFLQNEILPRS